MLRAFRGCSVSYVSWLGILAACGVACGGGNSSTKGPPDGPDATDGPSDSLIDASMQQEGAAPPPEDSGAGDGGQGVPAAPFSLHLVVDQFGYRTTAEKIAVIRNPQSGFDSDAGFGSGTTFALVDSTSGTKVLEAASTPWNGGAADTASGDRAAWFDFSSVTTPGTYYVLDETANLRSSTFQIGDGVYDDAAAQALHAFYYQRDGIAKTANFAGDGWTDAVEHPQNTSCAPYEADAGTGTKDLHGGWFDGGDQNKYTSLAARDAIDLLRAYVETPAAFGDGTTTAQIPESGNGVPDVLDEVKWALDWLSLMQNADGSLLTIVENPGASPPSADQAPCTYGPVSTSATLSAAAAFAYGSIVFAANSAANSTYSGYAAKLATQAANAWTWAVANPSVVFYNLPAGLGGREEEVDDTGRTEKKLEAAVFLYELNGGADYKAYFEGNYSTLLTTVDPTQPYLADTALEYTKISGADPTTAATIASTFQSRLAASPNAASEASNGDAYLAPLQTYPLGSNGVKAAQGNLFYDVSAFGTDAADAGPTPVDAGRYAERYLHYLHGVNPFGLAFLTNMAAHGATYSVARIWTLWFTPTSVWAGVGLSAYGPPPGFLPAGPDPQYTWDACCPLNCQSDFANAQCGTAPPDPPSGQPAEKSYLDFNPTWPLDSWTVSEPSDSYQAQYIRLASKFH